MPPNFVPSAGTNESNSLRADAGYWHQEFNARTPYEMVEDIPVPRIERVEKHRTDVLRHPLVQRLEPEDRRHRLCLLALTTSSTGVLCHLPFHSAFSPLALHRPRRKVTP
jgi:hypothetical protein